MTEPTTSGVTFALGAVTLTGTFLGMDGNALMAGLFGSFVALRYAGPLSAWGLFSSLATGTLAAGQLAPIVASAAGSYLEWLRAIPAAGQASASAFLIGVSAQTVLPAALKRLRGVIDPQAKAGEK